MAREITAHMRSHEKRGFPSAGEGVSSLTSLCRTPCLSGRAAVPFALAVPFILEVFTMEPQLGGLGASFQKSPSCPAPCTPAAPLPAGTSQVGAPRARDPIENSPSRGVLCAKLVYLVTRRYSRVWMYIVHRIIFYYFLMSMVVKLMNVLSSK